MASKAKLEDDIMDNDNAVDDAEHDGTYQENENNGGKRIRDKKGKNDYEKGRLDDFYAVLNGFTHLFRDYCDKVPAQSSFGFDMIVALASNLKRKSAYLVNNCAEKLSKNELKSLQQLANHKLPAMSRNISRMRNVRRGYTSKLTNYLFACLFGVVPFQGTGKGMVTLKQKAIYIGQVAEYIFQVEGMARRKEL